MNKTEEQYFLRAVQAIAIMIEQATKGPVDKLAIFKDCQHIQDTITKILNKKTFAQKIRERFSKPA